jgi:hypothetical protein
MMVMSVCVFVCVRAHARVYAYVEQVVSEKQNRQPRAKFTFDDHHVSFYTSMHTDKKICIQIKKKHEYR